MTVLPLQTILGVFTDFNFLIFDKYFLKSKIRVVFHERRLQYSERELIELWKNNRPGERIIDIGELIWHFVLPRFMNTCMSDMVIGH